MRAVQEANGTFHDEICGGHTSFNAKADYWIQCRQSKKYI